MRARVSAVAWLGACVAWGFLALVLIVGRMKRRR